MRDTCVGEFEAVADFFNCFREHVRIKRIQSDYLNPENDLQMLQIDFCRVNSKTKLKMPLGSNSESTYSLQLTFKVELKRNFVCSSLIAKTKVFGCLQVFDQINVSEIE